MLEIMVLPSLLLMQIFLIFQICMAILQKSFGFEQETEKLVPLLN